MKPSVGGSYEGDYQECTRCLTRRPARALTSGSCADLEWCNKRLREIQTGVK